MIYLNHAYEGAATRFESLAVEGRRGMALVFEHGLIHEGGEVSKGLKCGNPERRKFCQASATPFV